jgi:hypothetical protein
MGVEACVMYIFIGTLWFISVLSIAVTYWGASENLPRNKAVGLRTPGTLASDAGWRAGHRAAIPVMWLTIPVSAALSAMMKAMGPHHNFSWVTMPVALVLIAAAVVANKAARRVEKK